MEHAGDRPDLAAQTDLIADIEPGELALRAGADHDLALAGAEALALDDLHVRAHRPGLRADAAQLHAAVLVRRAALDRQVGSDHQLGRGRSEEHTSELQSLMRNSYAVFCLQKKKINDTRQ